MSQKNRPTDKPERVKKEEETLAFWKKNDIFQKTLDKDSPKGEFVFYEGPPTANGHPGIHHLESRAFKDVIPRYKTMQGFHVRRKGGWDTHGLPVEIEVEKELGISSKKEIEEYGIGKFNSKCKENVWKYVDEWEKFTERVGYWEDLKNPYVTYYPDYMETLWWIISEVNKSGLLYKDYKVLPWCPRCGTALSSHELAQGYQTVKDISITAKFELENEPNTFVLAWTTTPWTLPGNVALAVGEDIEYVVVEDKEQKSGIKNKLILAKDRMEDVLKDVEYEIVKEIKGKDLVGKKYKPLFPFLKETISDEQKSNLENAYKIYSADFVTTEEGTGVVHTAVMYGVDDFELGTKVGLPKHHLINPEGKFLPGIGFLEGLFVKDESTEVAIIKDLAKKGLLFAKGKYEHTYPFCWRCKTPLIYFARDSWYIKMTDLKDDLIKANKEIHWEPAHIKEGRFGEWLEGVKDWAISRERYWGTPLPIWTDELGEEKLIVDSFDTLRKHTKKSGNKYFVIRHGEAESNAKQIVSDNIKNEHHLTEKGIKQVNTSALKLKKENIDIIISSPFLRTKETAQIVAEKIGLSKGDIVFDDRIVELQTGGYNLKPLSEYHALFESKSDHFDIKADGGETLNDLKRRMGAFLYDIESKYKNKTILIVSHASPSWMLLSASEGLTKEELECEDCVLNMHSYLQNAEIRKMEFIPLPHNEYYERDLHRPYVDDFILISDKGNELKRVKEVMDVWFDSGSMPFAQYHYPFENKEYVDKTGYPADYISEAIDQTRGWFYTLHAVGALLGRGKAYKNVISLGLLLDANGQKMSKSKGNTVNPFEMIDKYGADTLRMWMYMVNQPGDSKNFDEKTVDDVSKKVLNLLENVTKFYEMYADVDNKKTKDNITSDNVLDVWIITTLSVLAENVTKHLDNYKLLEATRDIRDFIADLSQWYIRGSRDRFKGDDEVDKNNAIATTKFVLLNLSKLIAPFMPFTAEIIYKKIGGEKESVHLEDWSFSKDSRLKIQDFKILNDMKEAREVVSLALQERDRLGIKVRQPLNTLYVQDKDSRIKNQEQLAQLIKEEVNVKGVLFKKGDELKVELDTDITDELKQEGNLRELLRNLQKLRKEKGLIPGELIETMSIETDEKGEKFINEFEKDIKKQVNIKSIVFEKVSGGTEMIVDNIHITAQLK